MPALSLLLAAASLEPEEARARIRFREMAEVSADRVRLEDVADLSVLPMGIRQRAGGLVLLPRKGSAPAIPHARLAARARSLMPLLGPWLAYRYSGTVSLKRAPGYMASVIGRGAKEAEIAADEPVTLSLVTGIFTIERTGTALQSAHSGSHFFVRTPDGVVTALCCGDHQ